MMLEVRCFHVYRMYYGDEDESANYYREVLMASQTLLLIAECREGHEPVHGAKGSVRSSTKGSAALIVAETEEIHEPIAALAPPEHDHSSALSGASWERLMLV